MPSRVRSKAHGWQPVGSRRLPSGHRITVVPSLAVAEMTDTRTDLELPYLQTFAWAAELSSFTAAADSLLITQAAVSQRIHALEQDLGVALFERRGGRVFLTEVGQRLHIYAQRILDLHREARQQVTGKKTPVTGDLLLAASSIPGEHLLPGVLAVFRKQYPQIRVRATALDSMAVLDQVERAKVHLGLVGRKSDSQHLEFRPFATDEMVLVVPPDHSWRRRKRVSFRQFSQQPLIVREPGSGSRWCLEQALAENRRALADLQIALELGSNEAIKEAILEGVGVAVLSNLAVRKELETGQLHGLKIGDLSMDRTLFIVWDRRRVLPAPARIFLHFLERSSDAGTVS